MHCYVSKIVGKCVFNEDIHMTLQNGWTALMLASQEGNVECVKKLLDRGANISMQTEVSGVIITVSMQCTTYPESPVVDDDACAWESCSSRRCLLYYFIMYI